MARARVEHGRDDALAHLVVALAAVQPCGRAASLAAGKRRLDLGLRQARPVADVDLAQARVERRPGARAARRRSRRLVRAPQVARVDGVEARSRELRPRARAPARGRCRSAAGRPSPASGLRGSSRSRRVVRGGSSSRRYRSDADGSRPRRTRCASSPARPAGSASRSRAQLQRRRRARRHVRPPRPTGIGDLHVAADLTAARRSPSGWSPPRSSGFGRIDCLVNNVGGTDIRKLDELTDDDWQASFELNLMSAVRATRAALPGMRERGRGRSSTSRRPPASGRRSACPTTR